MWDEEEPQFYSVAVYHVDMCWGGKEEGGWWFDAGSIVTRIRPRTFRTIEKAEKFCARLNNCLNYFINDHMRDYYSVLSNGKFSAILYKGLAPEGFPDRRPHYE